MRDYELLFKDFLFKRGLKLTEPRRLILDAAFEVHGHFDAEYLYGKVRHLSAEVSLATVYRTLPLLIEAGLVQQSGRISGRDTFEHILGHPQHIHWICDKCQQVIETDVKDMMPQIRQLAEKINFSLTEPKLNFHGICWKCRESENETQ